MSIDTHPDLPEVVLDQAIGWLVRLQSGSADEQVRESCLRWRQAHPLHETAWQALQSSESAFRDLVDLPAGVALSTFERLQCQRHSRRQVLKLLGVGVLVSGVGGWGLRQRPLGTWGADYATGVGERRQFSLSDGTRLQLNTSSAADVRFSALRRVIELRRGEMFIDTGKDSATLSGRRSFWVESRHAQLQAIGTTFAVREEEGGTRLRVEEGVVAIHGRGQPIHVAAGEEYLIGSAGIRRIERSSMNASAWTRGQLIAKRMRLRDLADELARYRHGWLGCDPAVAELEISGVFQLDDIDRALSALGDSLPVRVERFTALWTRIAAR